MNFTKFGTIIELIVITKTNESLNFSSFYYLKNILLCFAQTTNYFELKT